MSEEATEPIKCNQSPHKQGDLLSNCNDPSELRCIAKRLWDLLDDIDTAGDMFKPSCLKSFKVYEFYVNGKQAERFKYVTSDGYDLFISEQEERDAG